MRDELDNQLCKKYPKIFRDRHADMRTTAMCWGFECDDGWYNILNQACSLIQGHIDWRRKQRAIALRYNRALKSALSGDISNLIKFHTYKGVVTEYTTKRVEEDITNAKFRDVPEKIPQVVATQVKEKFGTLRFYVYGSDKYCDGVISMAEALSGVTCEVCGNSGKTNNSGWLKTLCEIHERE